MTAKRKIDITAFPEKVVVLPEMFLTRKQLKQLYEQVVDNLNYSYLVDDGVEMSVDEVLDLVDEQKFVAFVVKELKTSFKDIGTDDLIDSFAGYDFVEHDLPSRFASIVQKSKGYKDRIMSAEDQTREREIARVTAQAEALGLTVTR